MTAEPACYHTRTVRPPPPHILVRRRQLREAVKAKVAKAALHQAHEAAQEAQRHAAVMRDLAKRQVRFLPPPTSTTSITSSTTSTTSSTTFTTSSTP